MADGHPDARVVLIDVWPRIRPRSTKRSADQYTVDYDAAAMLQVLATVHGIAIVVLYHTRKAEADDFVETVQGTLGTAGAADTVIVVKRSRGQADAALHVTGRDVEERELRPAVRPRGRHLGAARRRIGIHARRDAQGDPRRGTCPRPTHTEADGGADLRELRERQEDHAADVRRRSVGRSRGTVLRHNPCLRRPFVPRWRGTPTAPKGHLPGTKGHRGHKRRVRELSWFGLGWLPRMRLVVGLRPRRGLLAIGAQEGGTITSQRCASKIRNPRRDRPISSPRDSRLHARSPREKPRPRGNEAANDR